MKTNDKTKTSEETGATEKDGFFKRIVGRIDTAMKSKAEQAGKDGCCSGDGKGGKCC